ncbi:MAG: nucleotide exchange factor GrpE [Solirubrobacteraceae bacterium]|jgi:molecular chaperone GrpE
MHEHEEQHQPAVEQDEAPVQAEATDEERVEQDLGELLANAQAEREEYLALAQRTQADFENYRKRMARETAVAEGRGIAKVVKEILPALDNFELALQAADDDEVAEGFTLVRNEFLAALARLGIEPFSPEGEPFDPSEHEAMSQQPVEGVEAGTVASVYQQGYRIDGSVLRPARVVVAA